MDGMLADFDLGLRVQNESILREYTDREDKIPNLFSKLPPMKDALGSFANLSKIYAGKCIRMER
jgi:hypothetical protein